MTNLIFRYTGKIFFTNRISGWNKTDLVIIIFILINLLETQLFTDVHSKIWSKILVFLKRIVVLRSLWKQLRSIIWICYLRRKSISTLIVFLFLLQKGKWIVSFYIFKWSNRLFIDLIQFAFFKLHVTSNTFFYEILQNITLINTALISFICTFRKTFFIHFFYFL